MKTVLSLLLLYTLLLDCVASDFVERATLEIAPGVKLFVRASRFVPRKHTVRQFDGELLIDGRQVIGVDARAPRTQLDEAYLLIKGRRIRLDVSCLYNPWNTAPSKERFTASGVSDYRRIEVGADNLSEVSASFADGANAYVVRWWIVGGTALRHSIEHVD